MTKSQKAVFQISGGMCFSETKAPAGWHLAHKVLVKHNRITHKYQNSRILIRASFSASYPTILDDLCGKLDGIAARSQWEGSRKQKNKNHALNQIGQSQCIAKPARQTHKEAIGSATIHARPADPPSARWQDKIVPPCGVEAGQAKA